MGLLESIKNIMTIPEEDDFDDAAEETSAAKREESSSPKKGSAPRLIKSKAQANNGQQGSMQVVLVKPERFDDVKAIADHLNAGKTVVLNLESTNRDIARRLLDFLSGVAYANNGQIKRVANSTYIITPYNVDVMGDLIDELENNGMFI